MRCTPVRRAVQAISEPVGQLPLHVYRRSDDGGRERDRDHPVAKVLQDPNPWTSASDFREQLQRDVLLDGNAYAFINRVGGTPAELIRFAPKAVAVKVDTVSGEPSYHVASANQQTRIYAYRDIFHLKAPSTDGYVGRSIVNDCKEAIGVALVLEAHCARLFGNGARPSGVLTLKGRFGPEALAKAKEAWVAAHGGTKAGGTAVIPGEAAWQALTLSSVDAQFLELRRYAVDEIARAFNVPPHLLFEMGRATWANAAELRAVFVTFALMRWLKAWQSEIRLKLFDPQERDEFYAEFLLDDLLKADIAARAEAYAKLIAARVLNPNEARSRENMPPYQGGDKFENPNTATTPPMRSAA